MLSDRFCISGIQSNLLDSFLEAWEPCSVQSGMFGAKTALSPGLERLSGRTPGRGHEVPQSGATPGSSLQGRCPQEANRRGRKSWGPPMDPPWPLRV